MTTKTLTQKEIDELIGKRLRARRTMVGMSQEDLGKALNVTFQQIQKYERGYNRVAASRLFSVSNILSVPVSYFFDGMYRFSTNPGVTQLMENKEEFSYEKIDNKEILTLVRCYTKIKDSLIRRKLLSLIKSITKSSDEIEDDIDDDNE